MRKRFRLEHITIAVLLSIILVGGWFFLSKTSRSDAGNSTRRSYSAVFLANGQVYFGKLGNANRDYTFLTDIYYPQTQVKEAPASQSGENAVQEQPKVSLVKLGDEIQGPKDKMKINTSQILYIEELKEDGLVVKKIRSSKK